MGTVIPTDVDTLLVNNALNKGSTNDGSTNVDITKTFEIGNKLTGLADTGMKLTAGYLIFKQIIGFIIFLIFFYIMYSAFSHTSKIFGTCTTTTGVCSDNISALSCPAPSIFEQNSVCAKPKYGACENGSNNTCYDNILASECKSPNMFLENQKCSVGMCVDSSKMTCTDNMKEVSCDSPSVFTKDQTCSTVRGSCTSGFGESKRCFNNVSESACIAPDIFSTDQCSV